MCSQIIISLITRAYKVQSKKVTIKSSTEVQILKIK